MFLLVSLLFFCFSCVFLVFLLRGCGSGSGSAAGVCLAGSLDVDTFHLPGWNLSLRNGRESCFHLLPHPSFPPSSSSLHKLIHPTSSTQLTQPTGPHCTISAIQISSHVHIGAHTTIHPFAMIKENVKILPHTVVPANMIIPPGSVVAGRPARVIGEVGEGWGVMAGGGLGMGMSGGGGGGTGGGEKGWLEGGDLRELVRSIK